MKAILGNFKKISETEFHLKKDMQFAKVSIDETGEIKTVDYQDKQNIEIGDLLSYNSTDYKITNISADNYHKLVVQVEKLDNPEQNVPDKTKFIARKMTRRKTNVSIPISPNIIKTENEQPVQSVHMPEILEQEESPKPETKVHTPKKRNVFKRVADWLSSKLSKYSNS